MYGGIRKSGWLQSVFTSLEGKKKAPGRVNFARWTAKQKTRSKKQLRFLKNGGFKWRFSCCYCRFSWVSFSGSVTAESLQIILVCSSRLPPNLLLLPKKRYKKPCQCSAEVVSGGIPFALSPRLFAHRAQTTRPLVRKYREWNRPSIFTAVESLSSTSCRERDSTGK